MATTSGPSSAPLLPEPTAPGATTRPPPRPLHLLIPSPPPTTPPIPQTAPLPSTSTFSPTSDAPQHALRSAARRQSSISYLPPNSQPLWSPRRTESLHERPKGSSNKRASLPAPAVNVNANALTLAEKHADLLHFIAQKESRCLDLRAQLAAHEAELLQLKKKWERIVARDFGRAQAPPPPALPPPSAPAPSTTVGGNQMLDSLGRLFTAAPAPAPSAAVRPSPFAARHRITASSASSHATTSTAASSADRLSQSSVSSVGSADERVRRRRSGSPGPSALLADLEMEQAQAKRAGAGAGAGMGAWMGAGRRKLEELREGETFARSQKRASVLLADVSQSIFSVLSPGTPMTPALTAGASSASASLLDDDEPDEGLGGVLVPDALVPVPAAKSPMKAVKASAVEAQTQDDDDEWNW